jgi:precorrin-6A/cobalt-precorrin-6A reductase
MIWIIGGTSDASKIVALLLPRDKKILVSTTTDYGRKLAEQDGVTIVRKMLHSDEMEVLIKTYKIECVIDASHPFAEVVSKNAMQACALQNIEYFRFERKSILFKNASYYDHYGQIVDALQNSEGKILLTIGSKNINAFNALEPERLIVKVLPVKESIALCENAGLKAHQIIAMKGKVSKETNKALMLEYDITHLVTKDSGTTGGLNEKITAAEELGVKVHILRRPKVDYPQIFSDYSELIQNL